MAINQFAVGHENFGGSFNRVTSGRVAIAMHALIIEDESFVALAIEDVLRECGFTSVDVAPSSEDAIQAAARNCPVLITSDVQLQPGCGIETVLRICDVQPVPVIFITGNASEVMDRVPNAPVLMKPFSETELKEAVAAALTPN